MPRKRTKKSRDAQLAPVITTCAWCRGEIYLGQSYYEMGDGPVCEPCLPDYARMYFLSVLRTAMLRDRRNDT